MYLSRVVQNQLMTVIETCDSRARAWQPIDRIGTSDRRPDTEVRAKVVYCI